jgi:polysaccharide deacetylase 2 family uncharacterized protein YibQ
MNTRGIFASLKEIWRKHRSAMLVLLGLCIAALIGWYAYSHRKVEITDILPPEHTATPSAELPRIAIVIDDVGLDEEGTKEAIRLPAGITLSYLPYANNIQDKVNAGKAAGHEIWLHMPMEAIGGEDPGPDALRIHMSDDEITATVMKNFSEFTGYVGVNNHMGSRFSADEHGMRLFMQAVKEKGLMFLDSRTTTETKGEELALAMGVPVTRRNIFLDTDITEENVSNQFSALLKTADQQKYAVAIGHPHEITLAVLKKLLPYLAGHYRLVPVSELVTRQ